MRRGAGTEFYTDKLIEYIGSNLEDGKPFFAFAAYTAPHWPIQATNAYGVYDMVGNVWEWTADGGTDDAVLRGGSYLCSSNWCQAYRVSGRQIIAAELAAPHIGFRTVADF